MQVITFSFHIFYEGNDKVKGAPRWALSINVIMINAINGKSLSMGDISFSYDLDPDTDPDIMKWVDVWPKPKVFSKLRVLTDFDFYI